MSENEEPIVVTLEFDDGENVECEPLFIFTLEEYPDKEYIALIPTDEESEDVYLYQYTEIGEDEFEFVDIEDDAEFDKVAAEFEKLTEEAVEEE